MPKELRKDEELSKEESKEPEFEIMCWEPTEEDYREMNEQFDRGMEDKRLCTIVYDAGSQKKMTVSAFEHFYGTDKYSRELINAAEKRIQYSRKTAGEIKALYSKAVRSKVTPISRAKPDSKPATLAEPKAAGQDQFIPIKYGFVDKVKDADCHHNPTALLMLLLKHRTWPGKMDKHLTFTYWYQEKHLIVASRSIAQMAQEIGVGEKTIRRWLNDLEANGDIKKIKGHGDGHKRENIYILGEVGQDDAEALFYHQK